MKKEKKKEVLAEGSPSHYNAILIEDLKSKMDQVIDGMRMNEERVSREMNEFRSDVKQEFGLVKAAIGKNSDGIKRLDSELKDFKTEVKAMEVRLSDKIDSFGNRLEEHEAKPIEIAHPRHS